jgi:hypothetical protein
MLLVKSVPAHSLMPEMLQIEALEHRNYFKTMISSALTQSDIFNNAY